MLQTSSTTGRFALPNVFPARPVVSPRDIIKHHHEQSLGWITPGGERVEWFDGRLAGTTEPVAERFLDQGVEEGTVEIVAADVDDPTSCWWLGYGSVEPSRVLRTSKLELTRERSRNTVNAFLSHPVVDHQRGDVVGWKAAFGARYRGELVAVCVLSNPKARCADDGLTLELNRYAAHPRRPANTASWLIARAAQWAKLEGYDQLITYAGVANDNEGTIYQATNFERDGETTADGSGWQNRDGRENWGDYTRRRYVYQLHDDSSRGHRQDAKTEHRTGGSTTLMAFQTPTEDLTLAEVSYARLDGHNKRVTRFLDEHGENVPSEETCGERAVFAAQYRGEPVAVLVVTDESATRRAFTDARIAHLAVTDVAYPANVGAWLLGQVRDWVRLEGYHRLHPPASPTAVETASCKRAGIDEPESP